MSIRSTLAFVACLLPAAALQAQPTTDDQATKLQTILFGWQAMYLEQIINQTCHELQRITKTPAHSLTDSEASMVAMCEGWIQSEQLFHETNAAIESGEINAQNARDRLAPATLTAIVNRRLVDVANSSRGRVAANPIDQTTNSRFDNSHIGGGYICYQVALATGRKDDATAFATMLAYLRKHDPQLDQDHLEYLEWATEKVNQIKSGRGLESYYKESCEQAAETMKAAVQRGTFADSRGP